MLHGAEKAGKSLVVANLAVAGALAQPNYLGIPLRPGGFRTLIVQGEIHLRGVYERTEAIVRAIGGDLPHGRIRINEERNVALLSPLSWVRFTNELRSFRPDLVFIDPFAHVFQGDENSNQEVGEILQRRLAPLRDDPGVAIGYVHHDSKVSEATYSRSGGQRARGANRLAADPDCIWTFGKLSRYKGVSPMAKFEIESRYGEAPPPFRSRLNSETLWFELYSKDQEVADLVSEIIEESPEGFIERDALIEVLESRTGSRDARHRKANAALKEATANGRVYEVRNSGKTVYRLGGKP
jgi:hypothetical protein